MKPFIVLLGLIAAFGPTGVMAESPKTLPMPPTFNTQIDVDEALTKYPLGVITKVAALPLPCRMVTKARCIRSEAARACARTRWSSTTRAW